MKKLINAPDAVVREALEGMEAAHGDRLRVSYDPAMVVRADAPVQGKVGIISGGGSGHEPMHGGFVGPGMLDAACPGEVFTSPTPDQMLAATKAVDGGAGVLHIVKNYTGDVMNFEMAADLAGGEDIQVEAVVTNDDVAVQDSLYTAGRRGVGITVIAEKICGAAADEGKSLAEVAEICRRVNGQGRTMGMALTACITPGSGEPSFDLPDDEMEIGIGIHGEPGRFREPLGPASQVVERLATAIVEDLPYESGDQVLAFVNGMGGTPLIELYVVYNELNKFLSGARHHDRAQPDRRLHHLARDGRVLDHAAQARRRADAAVGRAREHAGAAVGSVTSDQVRDWLRRFADTIAEHRMELVRLDTAIGDGDHGTNMDRGMRKAMEKLDGSEPGDIGADLKAVGMALVSSVGGAAGPLYGTLFLQMGTAAAGKDELDLDGWAAAVEAGVKGVQARGKAEPGDKTMIDALLPALDALREGGELGEALRRSADAAEEGMKATIPLEARKGRASYLGPRSVGHQDPGATSSYYLLRCAAETLS